VEYFAKGKTLLGIAGEAMAGPGGQAKFVDGSLMRHITVMSLTASVGLMAIFAVDLVNMVFISWLKDVTELSENCIDREPRQVSRSFVNPRGPTQSCVKMIRI